MYQDQVNFNFHRRRIFKSGIILHKKFQIWKIVCDGDGGQYYIENTKYVGHRLAKWGEGDEQTGTYSGRKYEDQVKYFCNYSKNGCRTLQFFT